MSESEILDQIRLKPFRPLRLHLVNGLKIDVLTFETMMPLRDRLLLFKEMSVDGKSAKSFETISYQRIQRIEAINVGHRPAGTRNFRS